VTAQDIEYVELYVSDERATVDYFVSSFGFARVAESAGEGSHSSLLRQGTVQLVVTAGAGTREFLEAHGDGVADIAFACDDVVAARGQAMAAAAE
jgi:4-hydroxymandelate synthase